MVWEGNGKEILCTVGMGRKWEGNVVYCLSGKEMLSISKGRKWEGNNVNFPFRRGKGGK